MTTKLTLTIDHSTIKTAKKYAKSNNISLSKLIELYLKALISESENEFNEVPLITSELSGIAKYKTIKSDKELLKDALNKRHL